MRGLGEEKRRSGITPAMIVGSKYLYLPRRVGSSIFDPQWWFFSYSIVTFSDVAAPRCFRLFLDVLVELLSWIPRSVTPEKL